MIRRRSFNRLYVENELRKIATALTHKTTIFVAGGAAMAFYGLKEATKDIDVVVHTRDDAKSIVLALRKLGYTDPRHRIAVNYRRMKASAILENHDGFRWDIFEGVIAGKLSLSMGMTRRSQKLFDNGNLQASLLRKEDIFLLKSVTERDLDVEDMGISAESGVDWDVIAKECRSQALHSPIIWEDALCSRLMDLKNRRGIISPIEKEICRIADQKILEAWITRKVSEGLCTVKDLAVDAGEPEHVIRKAIRRLVRKKVLTANRSAKPHRFTTRRHLSQE